MRSWSLTDIRMDAAMPAACSTGRRLATSSRASWSLKRPLEPGGRRRRMTTKPVLLAVDDELTLLAAIERDLRREYGADFRIVGATSGNEALATLKQLKLRNEPMALLLVAQRMPQMTGVEFLEQAMDLFPDAKRVLLTAYADR